METLQSFLNTYPELPENRKGGWCPYDGRWCQEGFCEDCLVYREFREDREIAANINDFWANLESGTER
jgi:hypothetical protein